jgi:hypothetical protein
MKDISRLSIQVMSVYGIVPSQESQASYDTGSSMLTDGVVPYSDAEWPANLCEKHTLRFLPNVGHFYREEGSQETLWVAVRDWLIATEGSAMGGGTSKL